MNGNIYSFENEHGKTIDWSGFVGYVVTAISGHEQMITKEELAVIVGRKARECQLVRVLRSMRAAGEQQEARKIFFSNI
jgi:hypothetical protein